MNICANEHLARDGGQGSAPRVGRRPTASIIAVGKQPTPRILQAIKLDAKALDAFVGVYKVDAMENRVVTQEGGKLFMQRSGGSKLEIQPHSADGFFIDNSLTHMQFVRNGQGEVTAMKMFQGGTEESLPRTSATPPARRWR